MTNQTPDTCIFDERKWAVIRWSGSRKCIPTDRNLNIRTTIGSSANWSGRIDHFVVFKERFYLFKIEVTLAPGYKHEVPPGAWHEIVVRYKEREVANIDNVQIEMIEQRTEYYGFDKFFVSYTGSLCLRRPYIDRPERPCELESDPENMEVFVQLHFENGMLIGQEG